MFQNKCYSVKDQKKTGKLGKLDVKKFERIVRDREANIVHPDNKPEGWYELPGVEKNPRGY